LFIAGSDDRRSPTHSPEGCRRFQAKLAGLGGDQVGDLVSLEMAPHIFDWIEFWRIGRQSLDSQPPSGGSQTAFDAFSLRKIAKKFKLGASLLNKMKISSFQM